MAIDLSSPTSTPIKESSFNPIVPESPADRVGKIVTITKPADDWHHAGTIDFTKAGLLGYDGCGINTYGVYGVNEGIPKFLLASKGFDQPESWGLVQNGELRIAEDATTAGIADTTKTSLVFNPIAGTMLLNNASLIFRDSTHFVGINATGISGGINSGVFTFHLSNMDGNPDLITPWIDPVSKGELRIGKDVRAVATTNLRFLPGTGLLLDGLMLIEEGGGLWIGTYPEGLGLSDHVFAGSSAGVTPNILFYTEDFPTDSIYTSRNDGWGFRFGADVNSDLGVANHGVYISALKVEIWTDAFQLNGATAVLGGTGATVDIGGSADKITWTGTALQIAGNLLIPSGAYIKCGNTDALDTVYIDSTGISGFGAAKCEFLLTTGSNAYTNGYTSLMVGTDLENYTDSDLCPDLFAYNADDGLIIRLLGKAVLDTSDYLAPQIANNSDDLSVVTVARPGGGKYNGANADTGAIKIRLPVSWTNDMMKFMIDIYIYDPSASFAISVGGYNYSPTIQWINEFAQIYGNLKHNNRVRFGHDGTYCCVVIGETADDGVASVWDYPTITVRDFQSRGGSIAEYGDGWVVSVESDISGITFSGDFSNALLDAKSIIGQGALATQDITTYAQDAEPGSGMITGDTWIDTNDGNKMYRYTGAAWVSAQDASIAAAAITAAWASVTDPPAFVTAADIDWDNVSATAPFIIPDGTSAAGKTGLYADATQLGYINAGNWTTYMDSSGNFYLGGTSGKLRWNGTTLRIEGAIYATSGFITGNLYVGSNSSGIVLDGPNNEMYSYNYAAQTGEGGYAWKLDHAGHAYFNTINSIGSYLQLKAGNTGGMLDLRDTGFKFPISASFFNGGYNYIKGSYTSTSGPKLNIGDGGVVLIEIEPSLSTGIVNISTGSHGGSVNIGRDGYSSVNIDGNYVRLGSAGDNVGFFGSSNGAVKQTIDLDTGFTWDGAITTAGNRADIDTLYTMLWEACNKLKTTTLVNFTQYA